jgi:TonB family protein
MFFLTMEVVEVEHSATQEADSIPEMNDFVLLEREPAPVNLNEIKQQIGYPKQAKEQEIEGKVVLRILLDRQGNYNRHVLLNDPPSVLSRAIVSHIRDLKCSPGIQNGKPVWCWVTLPFNFKLLK